MTLKQTRSITFALIASTAITTLPALAADVTHERLVNADKEPQNWLMNHRTYDGQRYSPLTRINRDNVRNLKLAFAVPLGGTESARRRIANTRELRDMRNATVLYVFGL